MDVHAFVEQMFVVAVNKRVSDIHIQPKENQGSICFRIDGLLNEWTSCSKVQIAAIISKIKYIGHLDIGEKRLPQDGSLSLQINQHVLQLRLSTIPTIYGEKMVVRIFVIQHQQLSLEHLGFSTQQLQLLIKLIHLSSGLLLVTGPTGSGKTTTLYKIIERLATLKGKNIVSLEDPVEMRIPAITQTQVHPNHTLTFASGLRAILRQDPDIIFVGEIRDEETAEIAVRAALTGHFVLSTLHTTDAIGAIVRLLEMGIKSYYLASALVGVIAQRLYRLNCPFCQTGCYHCFNTGYYGRKGVYELIPILPLLKEEIRQGSTESALRIMIKKLHIPSISDLMKRNIALGITSEEEGLPFIMEEEWRLRHVE